MGTEHEALHIEPGFAMLGGTVGTMVVAGSLSAVRAQVGQVVPALALVVVVVLAAAAGGRMAGAYTAVSAALSFNFWHTQPYMSLAIHNATDIGVTLLLLAVGLLVGELAAAREHQARASAEDHNMLALLELHTDLVAAGASLSEVWAVTRRALMAELRVASARFEPAGTYQDRLPRIAPGEMLSNQRLSYVGHGFELPEEGAELPVTMNGEALGRIVLVPTPGWGASIKARRFAVTLAEQFAVAAAKDPTPAALS